MKSYNEKSLNIWNDRIERARKIRKKYFEDRKVNVKRLIDFYKGNQWGDLQVSLPEKPTVNLIFQHVKSQLPSLYFQNPRWYVRPKGRFKKDFENSAILAEELLNYYVEENLRISLKKQIRLAILDAFFSYGCIKVGYVGAFEPNPNYGEFKILGEDESGEPLYAKDENGQLKIDEDENIITNEAFLASRISPRHMLFDPECENYFESGRWVAQEIIKSVQDVINSKLYSNTNGLKESFSVESGYSLSSKETDYWQDDVPEVKDDTNRIRLYEIYDTEHDKILVFAEGHDRWLRNEEMPDGIEGSPFSYLRFNEIPDEMYPMSDIEPLKPIQEEYNLGRGMVLTHAKRFGRKYGYVKDKFGGEDPVKEIEKLKDPEDGTLFEVNELPLSGVIEPLADAPLDAAVYSNFEQAKQDFREVGGATEWDRGLVERRKTAYEASKLSGASNVRKEDRAMLVEDFCSEIGTKMLQSMQANLSTEEAIEIIGDEGKEWKTISRDDINGQYNVGVQIGTSAPRIPEQEKAELMELLGTLVKLPPNIILPELNIKGTLEEIIKLYPLIKRENIFNSPEQKALVEQKIAQEQMLKQQGNKGTE